MNSLLKSILILLIIFYFFPFNLLSYGSAGNNSNYESRRIVSLPNAGILYKNNLAVNSLFFENGGNITYITYSPLNRFNAGFSIGGTGIIGYDNIKLQKYPGIQLSFRVFNESIYIPAFLIGIDTQGFGKFDKSKKRFQNLSPGFYLVLSKSFNNDLGYLGFHFGSNYSFEPSNKNPNFYFGVEQSLGSYISFNFEANLNLNDSDELYMNKKVMFNSAFRFSVSRGVTIDLQFKDLLQADEHNNNISRNISLEFIL